MIPRTNLYSRGVSYDSKMCWLGNTSSRACLSEIPALPLTPSFLCRSRAWSGIETKVSQFSHDFQTVIYDIRGNGDAPISTPDDHRLSALGIRRLQGCYTFIGVNTIAGGCSAIIFHAILDLLRIQEAGRWIDRREPEAVEVIELKVQSTRSWKRGVSPVAVFSTN